MKRAVKKPTPRWMIWGTAAGVVLLAFLAGGAMQLRRAPDFYEQALAEPVEEQQQASDQCLANVTATVSQAQRPGMWRTEFTAEELNGWLAFDLPRNHPELLGESAHSPRVSLEEKLGRVAFEYRGLISTVVSMEFDAEVRDGRTLAIRLLGLHGGAVPLPLGTVIEEITAAASQLEHEVRWTEEDGHPVALVTMPEWEEDGREISLVEVRLEPARLVLLGETRTKSTP
jgi:hypothetical protein